MNLAASLGATVFGIQLNTPYIAATATKAAVAPTFSLFYNTSTDIPTAISLAKQYGIATCSNTTNSLGCTLINQVYVTSSAPGSKSTFVSSPKSTFVSSPYGQQQYLQPYYHQQNQPQRQLQWQPQQQRQWQQQPQRQQQRQRQYQPQPQQQWQPQQQRQPQPQRQPQQQQQPISDFGLSMGTTFKNHFKGM
jgi:hypothetical protein